MDSRHPKVFISHAGSDQERFVTGFTRRLTAKGVDAWYAKWEMQPGDKLLERIFDEGIGNADTLIIVLSKNSVDRPWVREEMDAGFVRRVEKKLRRLIPVIIEDCEIPVALHSTLHVRIRNLASYEAELDQIVSAIFGLSEKPELGPVPAYAQVIGPGIPGLTRVDNIVLKLACEEAIREEYYFVSTANVWKHAEPMGIPEGDMHDSIQVLHESGFIEGHLEMRSTIEHFNITLHGFHEYAKAYLSDINSILTTVAARIVNDGMMNSTQIRHSIDQPSLIIEYVLDLFTNQGWIASSGTIDGTVHIHDVSPQLKRWLLDSPGGN